MGCFPCFESPEEEDKKKRSEVGGGGDSKAEASAGVRFGKKFGFIR